MLPPSTLSATHCFSAGFNVAIIKPLGLDFVLPVGCLMLNYLYKYRYKIHHFSQNNSSASKSIVRGNALVCLAFATEKSDDLFFEELSKLHGFGMQP